MLGKLSDSIADEIERQLSPEEGLQDKDDVALTVERSIVLQLDLCPTLNSRRLEVLGQLLQGGLHQDAQLLHHLLAINLS